ncbi:MAG: efflux RND transporter periplasmic adaptor subunit [Myxococcota bacterium]
MTSDPISPLPDSSGSNGPGDRDSIHALGGETAGRRPILRWALPLLALALGFLGYQLLVATKEKPEEQEPVVISPLVRVMEATPEDLRLTVVSRGTVMPRTESDLVAEVRGRVVSVSPGLRAGGVFAKGDELLRLDDREFLIARDRARATLEVRKSEAALAISEARRRRELARRGAASSADLEQFENRERVANAGLIEAESVLAQARLDLERTRVRAPYDGRVRERNVDVGQFVSPGSKLGRIFAIDYAEIRLPIQTDDLAHLEFQAGASGMLESAEGTGVRLSGRLGGQELFWPARLVRAEAAIDERTRMLHVVARVDDPYALNQESGDSDTAADEAASRSGANSEEVALARTPTAPLPSGLFVKAEIQGRALEDVFVLPVMALRDGDRVFVVDSESQLQIRPVRVARRDRDHVIVDGGVAQGDQIVVSPLRIYSEGMKLRVVAADPS